MGMNRLGLRDEPAPQPQHTQFTVWLMHYSTNFYLIVVAACPFRVIRVHE